MAKVRKQDWTTIIAAPEAGADGGAILGADKSYLEAV